MQERGGKEGGEREREKGRKEEGRREKRGEGREGKERDVKPLESAQTGLHDLENKMAADRRSSHT